MQRLDAANGDPLNIHSALVESTANNINSLVFGGKFDAEKSKKKQVYKIMTDLNSETDNVTKVLFIPFLAQVGYSISSDTISKRILLRENDSVVRHWGFLANRSCGS